MSEKLTKINIHKDFHGAMSYGMQYVYEHYGQEAFVNFLKQIAQNVYKPLSHSLEKEGLTALENHWRKIFTLEGGKFKLKYEANELILEVIECPAIKHMQKMGYPIFSKFCEHTRIVNEELCHAAGYESSVIYDQSKGSCTQRFWKVKKS